MTRTDRLLAGPTRGGVARAVALVSAIASALALPLAGPAAQGVRITGSTWIQSIDVRPLREDSVPASQVPGLGQSRRTADGQLVHCPGGATHCYFSSSAGRETTNPMLQDLSIAAWGLGRGVSAQAHVRARATVGGEARLWPRLNDHFDALEAFVQVDRAVARARLGRLWASNGLGSYNYDGGALLLRRGAHSVEAYGGRALAQGLNETYRSPEIGAVDDLPPEEEGYLLGLRLRVRPSDLSAVSVVYQRVITGDRSGLYSERFSADGSTRWAGVSLEGAFAYDVAGGVVNEARARATRRLPWGVRGSLEARRHRPFFELWTIWGAFAPVGFDEGRAELAGRAIGERLHLNAHGAYRVYDDDPSGLGFLPLRSDGWRTGVEAAWLSNKELMMSASAATDIGFGASRSDAAAALRWTPGERIVLGARVTGFQSIYEFRVGTGRVLGAGVNGALQIAPDLQLAMDGGIYRHRLANDAPGTDWSQRRLSVRLDWTVGGDPGLSRGLGR